MNTHASLRTAVLTAALVGGALLSGSFSGSAREAQGATSSPYAGKVGVNTHLVWISESESRPQFERARSAGVTWTREEFPWRIVEPQRGVFDWRATDGLMASASAAQINVLGILGYSANWASSDPSGAGSSKYPPKDPADFARYAAAVVKRYGPNGSFWASRTDLTPRPLTAVQVWNEPWGYWAWKPNPEPARYAKLVRAAAEAIKAHDPSIKILVAGDLLQVRTDGAIRDWQKEVIAADPTLRSLFDAYSVHPYPYPQDLGPYADRSDPRWDFRRLELIHANDTTKPLWITEVGWSTASGGSQTVSEETQATYVRGAVERALNEYGSFVEMIFVYQFDRDRGSTSDRENYFGLRREDDSAKPAWNALVEMLASGAGTPSEPDPPSEDEPTEPPATEPTEPAPGGNGKGKDQEKPPKGPKRSTSGTSADAPGSAPALAGPAAMPRWYWAWARWRLGHGEFKSLGPMSRSRRPAAAPKRIPRWAWVRVQAQARAAAVASARRDSR